MEIRDVLHGSVVIENHERPVLESPFFQRLRRIKQLGFAEYSYPGATHTRFGHSIGAMHVASSAFQTLFGESKRANRHGTEAQTAFLARPTYQSYRALLRLAALLHDIGHGPLSHTTEMAMPPVHELKLPDYAIEGNKDRRATHEDFTLKMILDSDFTPVLNEAGAAFGFSAREIASLIHPQIRDPKNNYFFSELNGTLIDFFPILHQLISSELDCDRMDYLIRDSFYTGVSYGHFDFKWILNNLTFHIENKQCFLALKHRALYAFEDFLISRYHMFLMVYFHHKSLAFESMLKQFFIEAPDEYRIPAEINEYLNTSDMDLLLKLSKSSNRWAQRIAALDPFYMLIEIHSGIPHDPIFQHEQTEAFVNLKKKLATQNIEVLEAHTHGELSKYFRKPNDPIFVQYDNWFDEPKFIRIEECTDLFEKYQKGRSISRLYVDQKDIERARNPRYQVPSA